MYAGTERFLVEFLRRNSRDSLGLTAAQLESLAMLIIGAIWIAIVVRRHGGIGRPAANESSDALQPAV
jgi:phosphatidylglycerol:prolipoprotein diacylglycerol transferase